MAMPGVRDMIWNERMKLLANLLNTWAASFFTLWVVAPGAAFLYTGGHSGGTLWAFLAGAPIGVPALYRYTLLPGSRLLC